MTYIEVLPFAGSGGSIIKDYADNVARNMAYKKVLDIHLKICLMLFQNLQKIVYHLKQSVD